MKSRKSGLTIIELMFAIFIFSTLVAALMQSVNFIISKNKKYSAQINAYLIADTFLNAGNTADSLIMLDGTEYSIKYEFSTEKACDFLNMEMFKFELERYELPVKTATVSWTVNNDNNQISIKRIADL